MNAGHSLTDAQLRRLLVPGVKLVVFDAWGRNPWFATFRKFIGSTAICETERGILLQASTDRVWLADDMFSPIEGVRRT